MSAREVTLRALVIEDCARIAERHQRPAVARLLRRADVAREDLTAAALDLRPRTACAAALAMLGTGVGDGDERAAEILAEECGLELDAWIGESCAEQGVEVSL